MGQSDENHEVSFNNFFNNDNEEHNKPTSEDVWHEWQSVFTDVLLCEGSTSRVNQFFRCGQQNTFSRLASIHMAKLLSRITFKICG